MERSLSVLLPIRNLEATLANTVLEKLEVFSELTSRVELVLIDDGSEDATGEVADSLADAYPQIRYMRHGQPRGRTAAMATGVQISRGEVLFLEDVECRLPIHEVRRLWELLDRYELVLGRPSGGSVPGENPATAEHPAVTFRIPRGLRPFKRSPMTAGWVSIDSQSSDSSPVDRLENSVELADEYIHAQTSGSHPRPHPSLAGDDLVGPCSTIRLADSDFLAHSSRTGHSHSSSSQASPEQEGKHDGYLLARRWILEALHGTVAHCDEVLRYLTGRRIPWHEVVIERRMETPIPRRIDAASPPTKSVHWVDSWESTRADRTLFTSALRKAMDNSRM